MIRSYALMPQGHEKPRFGGNALAKGTAVGGASALGGALVPIFQQARNN
jgi:hypothetical protein